MDDAPALARSSQAKHVLASCAYHSGALTLWRHAACGVDQWLKALHLSPQLERGGVVLTFHRVIPQPDPFRPGTDLAFFEQLCAYLAKHYHVVSLEALEDYRRRGRLPPRCLALSFDDGYRDTYELAFPLLRRHGLPATVFVTTGAIDGSCSLWFDRVGHIVETSAVVQAPALLGVPIELGSVGARIGTLAGLIERLKLIAPAEREDAIARLGEALGISDFSALCHNMLTWDHLREMDAQGFRAAAHTVTHPILSRMPRTQVADELRDCKHTLETQLGRPVELLAYPNGKEEDINPAVIDTARQLGYRAAYTTIFGANTPSDDPYRLRRVTLYANQLAHATVLLERCFYLTRRRVAAHVPR